MALNLETYAYNGSPYQAEVASVQLQLLPPSTARRMHASPRPACPRGVQVDQADAISSQHRKTGLAVQATFMQRKDPSAEGTVEAWT